MYYFSTNTDIFKQAKSISKETFKATTSDEALKSYAISALTAALTAGVSEVSGLNNALALKITL